MGGDQEFYVSYFQEPGRAEAEIEPDVRGWLAGFYAALSADTMPTQAESDPHFVNRTDGQLRERFPGGPLPSWLTEGDLDGCGHWLQQERPDEVNRLLIGWLDSPHPTA
jgi:pimeloyl-ACP methyl ester carboxylesterase